MREPCVLLLKDFTTNSAVIVVMVTVIFPMFFDIF